jgi:peptidoglycan/LPS O-acetylase OafA/YrhL
MTNHSGTNSSLNSSTQDNLANIELLRGLAALLVVCVHSRLIFWVGMHRFWELYGPTFGVAQVFAYLSFPFAWGTFGVPLFFVISGYVIHRKPAQLIAAAQPSQFSTVDFFRRRFFKIYPTLLAALVITVLLDDLSNTFIPPYHRLHGATDNHTVETFFGNLFATQGITVSTLGSNGALWTLALEIQFYALFPLLFWLRNRIGIYACLGIVATINVASYFAFQEQGITMFGAYYLSWFLGVFIADREAHGALKLNPKLGAAVGLVFFAAGCAVMSKSSYASFQLWSITAAMAVVLTRNARFERGWVPRALRKVGEFSYSLYIIHVPVLTVFACWLYQYETQVTITAAALMVFVCLPFGWLLYWVIERPTSRWGRKTSARAIQAA